MQQRHISYDNGLPFEQRIDHGFPSDIQWHSNYILSFVLSGELQIHIENQTYHIHENDMILLEPYTLHSFTTFDANTAALTFIIDHNFMKRICKDIERIHFNRKIIPYSETSRTYHLLCSHLSSIILNTLKHDSCAGLKSLNALTAILTILIESYGVKQEQNEDSSSRSSYQKERLTKIMDYLNANYAQKISLAQISDYIGIHPQYFSSFFKAQFHTTFSNYLSSFRVSKSLTQLLNSDDSILEIAVCHGFNNHKTYSAAFKKIYHMSPTEFRKEHLHNGTASITQTELGAYNNNGYFSFFQQFWEEDTTTIKSKHSLRRHKSYNFDLTADNLFYETNRQIKIVSIGRTYACLRNDVREQIRMAKEDFDFEYLRLRDIFSDDLYVYYEGENKNPIYSWQTLDSIFDFLLSLNIKPFPEIGFMPKMLASKKQYIGWQYHPNVSYPKSLERWCDLVSNFMKHYVERYGIDEVRSWYFDFWCCPNLQIKDGYWNESQEKFFQFYKATYQAIKSVDTQIRLGTPTFSMPSGYSWYEDFFQYCIKQNLHPSYIAAQVYGCYDTVTNEFPKYQHNTPDYLNQTDLDNIRIQLQSLQSLAKNYGFGSLNTIVSDWNITFLPNELIRDTCFMGPYIAYSVIQTLNLAHGMCYWSLSDIHEDFFPDGTLFSGGAGMVDYHGFKKASYNAYYLLYKLGKKILDSGDYYILTQSDRGYQLLLFHLAYFDNMYRISERSILTYSQRYNIYETSEDMMYHVMLNVKPGTYSIKKYQVNQEYGSAFDIWLKMGAPQKINPEIQNYITNQSIPHMSYSLETVTSHLILDEVISPHGLTLFEIEWNME